jgi:hypothetical protein
MRCIACNKNLSDFESTRKSTVTGEYIDLCNGCYSGVGIVSEDREDLRDVEVTDDDIDDFDTV